jgi:3D (Asp-Asp-Asp) domain-containing protein
LNLRFWEKTLAVCSNRKYAVCAGIVAVLAVGVYLGVNACLHAGGVIPLSTRIPVDGLEQEPPVVELCPPVAEAAEQIQNPPRQDLDQELLDILRNSSVAGENLPQWKVIRMRVTAYCTCPRCCGKFSDGFTANMHKVRRGDVFIAADKKVSFGTEMIIPGYNQERPVEVKDRGRLIKGNHLDVFFNNHKVAQKWGTKYLDVLVKVEE